MPTDKIPDEIMREANKLWEDGLRDGTPDAAIPIARALMARDKRAAEIARKAFSHGLPGGAAEVIATAILTYGGRDEQR